MVKWYFCLLTIFFGIYGYSQTLNFSIGGNFTSGNLLSYGLNVRANINFNPNKINQFIFTPSFDYGQISNQQGVFELRRREILSILNYERTNGKFKIYVYNEIENSYLRKIKVRGSFGTGLSYRIISKENINFDVSELILPEIFQSSFTNRRDNWALRLSTRVRLSYNFKKWKCSSQILFQPAVYTQLTDGTTLQIIDNLNLRLNNSYEYVLSKNFSIGFNADFVSQTYPSFINPNVKPYDSNINLFVKGNI